MSRWKAPLLGRPAGGASTRLYYYLAAGVGVAVAAAAGIYFVSPQPAPPPPRKPPVYKVHDQKTFETLTKTFRIRPHNIANLEIALYLPKDWTLSELTKGKTPNIDEAILEPVAEITSEMISVHQLKMDISLQAPPRDISAKHWLKHYILSSGYALHGEIEETPSGRALAAYTTVFNNTNMFAWAAAEISGKHLVLVQSIAPLALKSYLSFIQKAALENFEMPNKTPPQIEEKRSQALINAVKFFYPESWSILAVNLQNLNRPTLDLQTKGPNGSIDGFIRIHAVRRGPSVSLMQEIESLKKHFSEFLGIDVKAMTSSTPLQKLHPRFVFSRHEVYKASYKKENHIDPEVQLVVLGDPQWYILVYMISPREQDNLLVWASDSRTLETIVKSMR